MPKRKADSPANGCVGDATNSPTPKKSKSEMKAEQLARAKAWHDARTNKAKGGAAAASLSLSSSSSFYAGMTTTMTTPTQLSVVRPPLSTSQFAVGDKRKDSERDRRKRDGMAAIRALREARASTGLADGRTEKRKSPPAMTNSHDPPNRAFEAESAARTSTSASMSDSPAMALSFVEMGAVMETTVAAYARCLGGIASSNAPPLSDDANVFHAPLQEGRDERIGIQQSNR